MVFRVQRLSGHNGFPILLLVGMLAPVCVPAQEPIVPLQLSFSDPGARSMGFGGAFVALADDATAAFANPAGLAQLLKPEVSIEGRHWSYEIPFTEGGRVEGLPSGYGIDSTVGLRESIATADIGGVSFLSLAYPVGDWSFALFRHKYADLEFFSETQGLFYGGTDCCQIRDFDQRATSDLNFVSYGLSAAYRISENFDIGFGLVYYEASLDSTVTQYLVDDDSVASIFSLNSYLPDRARLSQTIFFNDIDWTVTGGFSWRLTDSWKIGGVYRQGLKTGFEGVVTAEPAGDFGVPPGTVLFQASEGPLEFPDIYGLGVAYRAPDGRLTVSFQWDRVEYSSIPRSLNLSDQTIDDSDELHLGVEYVFLGSTPIFALRLGTWFEPDHQMRATTDDPYLQAFRPAGDDDMHYAVGLGVVTEKIQIDFAFDLADRLDTLSMSAIYSF